jgi:aminopeptidase N
VRLAVTLVVGALVAAAAVVSGRQDAPAPTATPSEGTLSPRNANYEIDARLDHDAKTITGRETIRWRNVTGQPTSVLQLHLYWNAWRNADSTWMRERRLTGAFDPPREGDWSAIDVTAFRVRESSGDTVDVTPRMRFIAPDDGNALDRTVMEVDLGRSVGPNETVEAEVEWKGKIPRPFVRMRTGWVGDFYFIGQWFPKLGVLEERGWNTHQFHASTEFFADFGVYDVRLTLPRGFVVGASGREVKRTDNADGTTTHEYRGEDIHDFAWTASPDYVEMTRRFEHRTLPPVEMRLLLQPERRSQAEEYFAIVAATLQRFGEWFGPYPYGYLTIVDPAYHSESDGMEYPTLFVGRSRWLRGANVQTMHATTAHEAGHQWWYGMVATNEFEHAWMDEGINSYATARVMDEAFRPNHAEQRYFGGFVPWAFRDIAVSRIDSDRLANYRLSAEADAPWTPSFRYWPATSTAITYSKTALWLHTLERRLGWPTMQRILATYFERWKFKHPKPADFFDIVREVSGHGQVWFFDEVYRSSNTFDYGVQEFRSERLGDGYRTTVVARRFGEGVFPVEVVTTFEDGSEAKESWDGRGSWDGQDRRAVYTYERPSRAVTVRVDPERVLLLDVAYTNNSRTVAPRSDAASLKWSLKWMAWLQDLMLTYAFFI